MGCIAFNLPALAGLVLILLLSQPSLATAQWPAASSDYHEQGRAIYNFRCYFCHGYSGDARTLTTSFINPPPRNFKATGLHELSREQMVTAVTDGKPGTAMTSFSRVLNGSEIETVVDFIRAEFMRDQLVNTRYHTAANGWSNHERYQDAFPFATGQIALDAPWSELDERQKALLEEFKAESVNDSAERIE